MAATSRGHAPPWPARILLAAALAASSPGLETALGTSSSALAEAQQPTDPNLVLLRLREGGSRRDPALAELVATAKGRPGELAAALPLAAYYVELGRLRQDTRYMGYAQAALAPWWGRPDAPPAVRLIRADIAQHRHAFKEALAELEGVIEIDPRDPRAWLARAQILMVTGQPVAASEACAQLGRLRQTFAAAVCLGSVQALTGRGAEGRDRVAHALRTHPEAPTALQAWAYGALAEIELGLGDGAAADRALAAGRSLDPSNEWLANAAADRLLAAGQAKAAAELIGEQIENDGRLLRLAIATARQDRDASIYVRLLEARFAAGRERGDSVTQREEARFRLELTGEALQALALAQDNWRNQREVEDARLLLAAAVATGQPEAARPVLAWMTATGIVDARLQPLRAGLGGGQG